MKKIKLMSALILVVLGSANLEAQTKIDTKPTIIFVHGIWSDGSAWSGEITTLQAKGYNVISVQNPLTSLADDVAAVKRAIDMTKGKVILVGHSWGGFVITQAGNNPKVAGLVYVAAFAPENGETLPELIKNAPDTELGKYFVPQDGFIYLSHEGIQKVIAADLPPAVQNVIFATQIPASQTLFGDKSGEPAWKQKPSWFIVSKNDKTINPVLERFMAKRIGAKTIEIEASHVGFVSHTKEVIAVIEEAANNKK